MTSVISSNQYDYTFDHRDWIRIVFAVHTCIVSSYILYASCFGCHVANSFLWCCCIALLTQIRKIIKRVLNLVWIFQCKMLPNQVEIYSFFTTRIMYVNPIVFLDGDNIQHFANYQHLGILWRCM